MTLLPRMAEALDQTIVDQASTTNFAAKVMEQIGSEHLARKAILTIADHLEAEGFKAAALELRGCAK